MKQFVQLFKDGDWINVERIMVVCVSVKEIWLYGSPHCVYDDKIFDLKNLEESGNFIKIHNKIPALNKSLVNKRYIRCVKGNDAGIIILTNGEELTCIHSAKDIVKLLNGESISITTSKIHLHLDIDKTHVLFGLNVVSPKDKKILNEIDISPIPITYNGRALEYKGRIARHTWEIEEPFVWMSNEKYEFAFEYAGEKFQIETSDAKPYDEGNFMVSFES